MSNSTIQLSIVTLNYNGFEDTCEMIESLEQNAGLNYELIVVDNNSIQDESAKIKAKYPSVICIRTEKNLGYAGGNNIGIKKAKSDLVLLLNNDTVVPKNALIHLVNRVKSSDEIGAVSPKIVYHKPPHKIQFAGITELTSITLRNRAIGYGEPMETHNEAMSLPYLHGCAFLFKKEILKKVGYMPELYFLYYEELDWSVRIRQAGYKLYLEPKALIFHKGSQSVGMESPLKAFYMTRNRLLFATRNRKGFTRVMAILYIVLIAIPKAALVLLLKRKFQNFKSIFQGLISYIKLKNKHMIYKY
jgi:GT2 family glycosyltransferase